MIEEHDMEPMAAKKSSAIPRFLFSMLALCVGLFVATFAVPAHAQTVAPNDCAEPAEVADGSMGTMTDPNKRSVAVGCDSEVKRTETQDPTESMDQPLLTLDAGNDGSVDRYLIKVDCDTAKLAACEGKTGVQYASISQALHMRLGQVATTPLTDEEMAALTKALADIQPLGDITVGLNALVDTSVAIMVAGKTETKPVAGGVAVGGGAQVKADGGVAIGSGAMVGKDTKTKVTLVMDETGLLVVGTKTEKTGGGGNNGVAIGNGAKAMGKNSIAIGSGAVATEEGQVMIGSHDIGAMDKKMKENTAGVAENAAGVAANKAGVAANKMGINENRGMINNNSKRLDNHDVAIGNHNERLMAHGKRIDENRGMINSNSGKISVNAGRINQNRGMINGNSTKIENNAGRINENRGMINSNSGKISVNAGRINENRGMINSNVQMLNKHGNMIQNAMGRLNGHDTALTAHENRLNQHSTMLAGHAEGINNNAMQIDMLDERVSQVAAMSAALSAVPNAPDMEEQFFFGVGVGSHGGESGVAAGLAGRLGANKNIVVNAGVANSSGGTSIRAGVGWSF